MYSVSDAGHPAHSQSIYSSWWLSSGAESAAEEAWEDWDAVSESALRSPYWLASRSFASEEEQLGEGDAVGTTSGMSDSPY